MKYYAVRIGRLPGVYDNWEDCKAQVDRYPGAEHRSFTTRQKADDWIVKKDIEDEQYYSRRKPSNDGESSSSSEDSPSSEEVINVFTDGACSNNGKYNARAGLGVYFAEGDPRNFSGSVFGKQTNNTAEIKAIIKAFKILEKEIKDGDLVNIYSDSTYAMRAAGEYGRKQEEAGWKNDIPNKNLVKKIYGLFKGRDNVKFIYVKAHTGEDDWISRGNEMADECARQGARQGARQCDDHQKAKLE